MYSLFAERYMALSIYFRSKQSEKKPLQIGTCRGFRSANVIVCYSTNTFRTVPSLSVTI